MIPLGDFVAGSTVRFLWPTFAAAGGSITRATDGSLRIYKNSSDVQRTSSSGITDTEDFDSLTGVHFCSIDLSDNADSGFYAAGNDYFVVLVGAVIDGQTVNVPLAFFSIENRTVRLQATTHTGAVIPTVSTLTGHTAQTGDTYARLGAPAGASVSADVAAVKSQTQAIETDTQDIQGRLPASLVGGRIDANVGAISSDSTAADNAESFFDGTGYAGTNNVIPNVTTVTNLTNAPTSGDLTATMKASVNTEVDTALSDYGALRPTVAGRTLDVSVGGEAGVDWANVGSPTTTLNLSGTTVKTATDVETDTQDLQSRLPAALTGAGNIKADVIAISGDTAAADNLEAAADGTGFNLGSGAVVAASVSGNVSGNVVGSVGSLGLQAKADVNAEVADAVGETEIAGGETLTDYLRYIGAILAGRSTGTGTSTEVFYEIGSGIATPVVTFGYDDNNNRTSVTYS